MALEFPETIALAGESPQFVVGTRPCKISAVITTAVIITSIAQRSETGLVPEHW